MKIVNVILIVVLTFVVSYGQNGVEAFNKGFTYMDHKEYEKAKETFSVGIELNDIAKSANYYGRAYANYELGNLKEAELDIQESLKSIILTNKDINSDIYSLRGMIAGDEGNLQLEIESYKKAVKYTPERYWLKTNLGYALIENNEFNEAIHVLTEVIKETDQDAYAFTNRALGYIKIGNIKKAKSDLDNSKRIDSENPFLYRNYFYYYKEIGEMENACRSLEEALKKNMSDYGLENDTRGLKKLKEKFCS